MFHRGLNRSYGRLPHAETRGASLIAWLLVSFYVLASCRALLPGLCATQAAMERQCGVNTDRAEISDSATHCCPLPADNTARQGNSKRPVTPAESHCAFCNLIIGLTDPPQGLVLPAPAAPRFAERVPLVVQVARHIPDGTAPNRAPPA